MSHFLYAKIVHNNDRMALENSATKELRARCTVPSVATLVMRSIAETDAVSGITTANFAALDGFNL